MNSNNNIIIIFLVVAIIGAGVYFFSKKKDTKIAPGNTDTKNTRKCYNRFPDTEPFKDNFNPDFFTNVQNIISVDLKNTIIQGSKDNYVAGFLKGVNAEMSARNVTLYQSDIKEWIASTYAMPHWQVKVGELLCTKA